MMVGKGCREEEEDEGKAMQHFFSFFITLKPRVG